MLLLAEWWLIALKKDKVIDSLTIEEFKSFSVLFDDDIYEEISLTALCESEKTDGRARC